MVPPIEFGAMHAILFQLALIPLTMSRLLLARVSTSRLGRLFPMESIMQFHIHIGCETSVVDLSQQCVAHRINFDTATCRRPCSQNINVNLAINRWPLRTGHEN